MPTVEESNAPMIDLEDPNSRLKKHMEVVEAGSI